MRKVNAIQLIAIKAKPSATFMGRLGLIVAAVLQPAICRAQPVNQAAAGYYHSLFLKSGGSLWAMGQNLNGQLGDGTFNNNTNRPEQVVATNVTAIAAGSYHSLFLKNDGSLWAMGRDANGQLGNGTNINLVNDTGGANQPEQIVATNVTAIAAGSYHSLFLQSDGSVWGMGKNQFGQLGDGTYGLPPYFDTNLPVQVLVAGNVTAIAAGYYHGLLLKSDGSLWAMGLNSNGQLGDGTFNNTNRPEQIVASNVTAIAAGGYHSLFLKSDGSLWAMGYDLDGQLGDGVFRTNDPYFGANQPACVASNVTAIAAGGSHSLFLKSDGSLWAMGKNLNGQLGDGTNGSQFHVNSPELIVAGGVAAISAGELHSLFFRDDGSLWGMGDNQRGQLGDIYHSLVNRPEQILGAYNYITGQLLEGDMQLAFVGIAGANYALDCAFNLAPSDWVPQNTNAADSVGVLVFTNTPIPGTNNFWRIRSVP
jgi:alpha-tubulin suppressor-like RCC1 family protein